MSFVHVLIRTTGCEVLDYINSISESDEIATENFYTIRHSSALAP